MGCQKKISIGDNLEFSICTHDRDTGLLTNADANPSYRIYKEETATAILTGSMARIDSLNNTGLYVEQVSCTVANGFSNGCSYTIYITAVVNGNTGGICYAFLAVSGDLPAIKFKLRDGIAFELIDNIDFKLRDNIAFAFKKGH